MATEGTALRIRRGACLTLKHCVGYMVPVSQHFTNKAEGRTLLRARKRLKRNFQRVSGSKSSCVTLAVFLRTILSLCFFICSVNSEPIGSCLDLSTRI